MNKSWYAAMSAALLAAHTPAGAENNTFETAMVRDPTRPLSGAAVRESAPLRLQAIFIREGRSYAIINGNLVAPGSRVADVTIAAIEPSRVHYVGPRQGTLHLEPPVLTETAP